MTPHDIEQMKAKAEAGTVITQQEAHQALAEILRLREASEWASIILDGIAASDVRASPESTHVEIIRARDKLRAALNGDAP